METLIKFKQFVDEINLENGRNYKLSVLEKYRNDDDIKYYLQFVFDPFIVTGISDKSVKRFHLDSCIDTYPTNIFKSTKEALEYLKLHNTGTNETLNLMFSYYMTLYTTDIKLLLSKKDPTNLHELFEKIITKNLILGISGTTINKVFGKDTIKEFKVQLAEKFFDQKENFLEGKEFAITTKIDGMRCIMLKENGNVTFWSRQGQQIEGLVDLVEEAKYLPDNICLDGELIAIVDNPDTYKDTMKRARTKDAEKHGLKMMVFDYMEVEEFKNQTCSDKYKSRVIALKAIMNCQIRDVNDNLLIKPIHDFKYFERLKPLYIGTDTNKIIELLDEQTLKGEEGIMINILDAPYEFKRSSNLLKVKKFQTLDLEVVGFEEGTNSNQGTLGALLVRYKDENIVKVGSGFEKDLRNEIWNNQKDWLGRIVEVQYFEETENADGNKSLRFPVYKEYRTDKSEADY